MNSKKNISAYSILDYSQCKYKTWLDFIQKPNAYPKNIDPWLEIIRKIGIEHEESYLSDLKKGEIVYEIDKNLDFSDKEKKTDEAIKKGEKIIYQPFLKYGKNTGSPDFLVKSGDLYEPWDIKSSFKLKPENILQICHYSYILDKKYNLLPKLGKIILRDRSVQTININKFYDYFLSVNKGMKSFIDKQNKTPYPSKCNLCNVCEYKLFCEEKWKNDDHLNQVANVTKKQINILEENNIKTLKKLAETNENSTFKGINQYTLEILIDQAKLQQDYKKNNQLKYQLIYEKKKRLKDPLKLIGFEILPKSNDNDLFFDIEGYPMYYDPSNKSSGLEYLFGVYYRSFGKEIFKKFIAKNTEEEKVAFEQLIDFLFSHLKKNKDAHVYHYNSYEETAIKKLSQKFETKISEVDYILREKKFIDLYKVLKDSVILSVENYRLKTIEKFYKLDREDDITSGLDSLVAFEKYLESGHEDILNEIVKYNKQDCKSLIYLQEWIEKLRPKNLESPPQIESKPLSENAIEQIKKENDVEKKINDIETEDENIISILKQLNFYNRKEQRPDWWSHFSNIEKNTEEFIEDNNCVGGMTKINETINGSNRIANFIFPEQITKMKTGDYVLDQNGLNRVFISNIDYGNNKLSIRIGKDKPIPTSLTPSTPITTRSIDNAVSDFIINFDYKNSYPAIKEFLKREDSKYKQNLDVMENSIDSITKRIKNLNNSYLVIQGPPGTGKTFTISRVIVDLIKNNYKIAIVCHSHKAIINLIEAIDDYSSEINLNFEGIYNSGSRKLDKNFSNIEIKNTNKIPTKNYDLIAGTAWALSNPIHREDSEKNKNFDYIFFDEAGQISISKLIASSMSSKNIIMIGDHMQLPQPSVSTIDGDSSLSPIEYLLKEKNTISDEKGIFLDKTYRMHSNICTFISDSFYENRLISDISNANQIVKTTKEKSIPNGIYLLDLKHEGSSVQNNREAEVIRQIYNKLINKTWIDREKKKNKINYEDILVVSPFNAQVNLIKEKLGSNALVGTIDNFQGQEAPIVIISYSASDPENIPRGTDFFFDFRRLNVSLSRAKCLAIILINQELFDYHCNTVEDMERLNFFCKLSSYQYNQKDFLDLIN